MLQARRLLGLPSVEPHEPAFDATTAEIMLALRLGHDYGLSSTVIEQILTTTGRHMWQLAADLMIVLGSELIQPGDTEYELAHRYADSARMLAPASAPLVASAFQAHLRDRMRDIFVTPDEAEHGALRALSQVTIAFVDVAQPDNRVTLDPTVKDIYGLPVARITYSPHRHEQAAQRFYMPQLIAILKAAGADLTAAVPATSTADFPVAGGGDAPSGAHTMGGMRTGTDPTISVCDPNGRIQDLDNVFVTDASVFVTSGAVNPTLTLMALALRNAVAFSGLSTIPPI